MSKKQKRPKFSRLLTSDQVRKYREIGEPDVTQNYLELFTPSVVSDLFTIMRSCSDSHRKSDYVSQELGDLGFEDVGLGTNIMTMSHPVYPGVVFKVALDDYGLADNFNDCILQDIVPKYAPVYARHPSGIVTVQKRGVLMTDNQMSVLYPKIMALLKELSKHFLVADLSPDMFLNYAIDRDGDFMIIDGSDLYPLHQLKDKIRCTKIIGEHKNTGALKYCEGKLEYTEDFKYLVCKKCGREYNPLQFRPKKEVKEMSKLLFDGMSLDEMMALEDEAIQTITGQSRAKENTTKAKPSSVFVAPTQVTLKDLAAEEQEDEKPSLPRTIFVEPDERPDYEEPVNDTPDEDEDEESDKIVKSSVNVDAETRERVMLKKTVEGEDEAEVEIARRITIEDSTERVASGDESESPVVVAENEVTFEEKLISFGDKLTALRDRSAESFDQVARHIVEKVLGKDYIREMLYESEDDPGEIESPRVQNDLYNTNMSDEDSYESTTPHIHYQVVNEAPASASPGIYLKIYGDFEKAYDESGLPVFVSIDDGRSFSMAIMAGEMMKLMKPAIDELIDESNERRARQYERDNAEDESEDANDEDGENSIESEPILNHKYFEGLGETPSRSDEDEDDE